MHIFNVIYNYAFNSHLCSNICLVMMIMIIFFVLLLFITKQQKKIDPWNGKNKRKKKLFLFFYVFTRFMYSIYKRSIMH